MKIIYYKKEHQYDFERLNKEWMSKYFDLEPLDIQLLSNPEEFILKDGGTILFAEYQGHIIGTVALVVVNQNVYELAKMTVDEAYHGLGAGKFLCRSAIEEAKKRNAEKVILYTNSRLETAINIYRKFGFKNIPVDGQPFKRANIKMELILNTLNSAL